MADTTPQKRELPARERRESAAKRRASSPAQPPSTTSTPSIRKPSTTTSTPATGRKTGYIRGPYKKRTSIAQIHTPTSVSRSSPAGSLAGDVLPTRMVANKALPTSKHKQPAKLSIEEYQSVAESATIAASLYQSRIQWLYNGIFEKYYVKKRKGVEVPLDNPDIKSMQRLGAATLTVEPHAFDVFFYVVKDFTVSQAIPRHPNQHTVKPMGPPSHPAPYPGQPLQSSHLQPPQPATHSAAPLAPVHNPSPAMSHSTPQPVPSPIPASPASATHKGPPAVPAKLDITGPVSTASVVPKTPPSAPTPQTHTPQPSPKPNPPPPAKGSTQDPVIQMLAARAASDSKLKDLMKIVATSRATPEQLKEFQSHIDEFNEVIRRQEAERVAKSEEGQPKQSTSIGGAAANSRAPATTQSKAITPQSQPTATTSVSTQAKLPVQPPAAQAPPMQPRQLPLAQTTPTGSGVLPGVIHPFPNPPPPAVRGGPRGGYAGYPPQPPPRPEPFIKHVVMEITSLPSGNQAACPDRWLFPEHAVLEMRPNGLDMICSFLVERKGSQLLPSASIDKDSTWKAGQDYYQPVTTTIRARDHKIIQTIAKAAKTLPAVQEYMKEVMSKKQQAPVEYLVHQLPRGHAGADKVDVGFVDSGVDLNSDSASEDDELKDVYGI